MPAGFRRAVQHRHHLLQPLATGRARCSVYVVAVEISYHVAILKGTDVDQPRNLAKSVTVE